MRVVLGVDAGGSKTHAVVVDESGAVLGFGKGGVGNHQSHGLEAALKQIAKAVNRALQAAQVPAEQVELGCFCLAGADLPEDYKLLQSAVEEFGLAQRVVIKNDTLAALRSGLSRSWGVVVICGSGFNAAGRGPDGGEIVLPGLGPISGDWGGGGALSIEMIRAVMRSWDGRGQPTRLTRLVLDALGQSTEEELLAALYHRRMAHKKILDLTPLLFEAADAGDEVACKLVTEMGVEVGVTAAALLCRLDLTATDSEVVLGGSVFKGKGPLLVDTAARWVHQTAPAARIVQPRLEPVGGAALLALELAGIEVTSQTNARMEKSPVAISSRCLEKNPES
jgi:N-acetylglucosamine kinase-like BadF-type ATPase